MLNVSHLRQQGTQDLCSRQDVARLFNVAPCTVSRWAKKGHIKAVSMGRKFVGYDFSAVLAFVATR
jgi:predicted site-specific integrase-resolvase